jgi:cell shape-determining protein MreD
MRASILLWSMASGAILGLFIDATLIGVTMLASAVIPALSSRMQHRWVTTSAAVVLALIPLALIVVGFLEGQLKTR